MTGSDVTLWQGQPAELAHWRASAADGSRAQLSAEGAALQLDFHLGGHAAWVIARCDVGAVLPAHYAAIVELRGSGRPVELQVKLVDPSGANVWWWRRPFELGAERRRLVLHQAALEFAWGPASGGDPSAVAAVEVALASDSEMSGSLVIDALRLEARDPASARPVIAARRASSASAGHEVGRTGDEAGYWTPAAGDDHPWLELDLGRSAEFGGVVIDCVAAAPPCRLLVSADGAAWTGVAESGGRAGRRRWLRTDEGEGRYVRIAFDPGARPDVAHVAVAPLELAVSPSRWVGSIALGAPRGRYPRHLVGEQAYWAVVGADGDTRKGLLGEDGALEVDAESFTLEPFLWTDGRLLAWADVDAQCSLADGHLPVPSVAWRGPDFRLDITAFAAGAPERSTLVARYALTNTGAALRRARLFVAVRPFQVTPEWQRLNLAGGVAPITALACAGSSVLVNGARRVTAITEPDVVGAGPSERGLAALATGGVPELNAVDDPIGFAEAAFAFDLALGAGETAAVALAVPLHDASDPPPAGRHAADAAAWVDAELRTVLDYWRARLTVPMALPPAAQRVTDTLRASLGWILVNREGPRIQPGPRCYRRSWIRDGTLTSTALAEMGFPEAPQAFLRWYAPYQLPDGRVPCAVDRRGVDHAVEHDSHGQLIWGVVETFRLTGDRAFLRELWPHVLRAVEAIAALRATRTTSAYRGTRYFGLLPESISHEGYAWHPVHSYWDDLFAVRGLADAADAAALLGDGDAVARIAALRDAMRADLHASIAATIGGLGIDFVPGSAELGDFDPTSTAIAFDPCGEAARLPAEALRGTFDRYWQEFDARRRGETKNQAYTPYEVRAAAALVMLGHPERAVALLEWLIADQRPRPWCQWPEIAWHDPRAPRFLGDLPHGWIASSFLRAVRRLLAYEREDGVLVLGAGVPEAWVRDPPGVRVTGLPTHFGRLDYAVWAESDDRVRLTVGGDVRPPGGIVVVSPLAPPLRAAIVDGEERPPSSSRQLVLTVVPSNVVLLC